MGLRLIIESSDINDHNYLINVYLATFSGTPVTRKAAAEFLTIDWGSKSGTELPNIYGSSATITFYAENDAEFIDIFSAAARDVYVEIYITGTSQINYINPIFIWQGFVEPENWREPLRAPDYEVVLTAYDGLGFLKEETFLQANGDTYIGEKTPIEILAIILEKTGISANIYTAVSLRESTQPTNADPLTQYKKEVTVYEGMNCAEILEQLFKYCRIFQRAGQWYIISNNNWGKTTINTYKYTSAGLPDGTSYIAPVTQQAWVQLEGQMELLPAVKRFEIFQDYKLKDNLVFNADFKIGDFREGNFEKWTPINVEVFQRRLDDKGNRYVQINGGEIIEPTTSGNHTQYFVSDPIRVFETTDIPTFSAKYALIGTTNRTSALFFGIQLITDTNVEYWLFPSITEDDTYEWVQTTNKLGIPVQYTRVTDRQYFWQPWTTTIEPTRIPAYPVETIAERFDQVTIPLTPGIPYDGEIRVYLYPPNFDPSTNRGDARIAAAAWTNVVLNIMQNEEGEELPTSQSIVLTNNNKNNYTPQKLEFINGDAPPEIDNNTVIYAGVFVLTDNTATQLWVVDGISSPAYTYVEAVARLLSSSMRQPRQSYNISIANFRPKAEFVIVDTHNDNLKLVEAGISFNARMETIQGRYIEVITDNIVDFETGKKTSFGGETSSRTSSSGSSSTNIYSKNTDEKVGFIDPVDDFALCNEPGYLNIDYFEPEKDTDPIDPSEGTGRVSIKPSVLLIHQNFTRQRYIPNATGKNAIAIGEGSTANSYREISIGTYNQSPENGNPETWVATDMLISIGNGAISSEANAFEMLKNAFAKFFNAVQIGKYVNSTPAPNGVFQYDNFPYVQHASNKYKLLISLATGCATELTLNAINQQLNLDLSAYAKTADLPKINFATLSLNAGTNTINFATGYSNTDYTFTYNAYIQPGENTRVYVITKNTGSIVVRATYACTIEYQAIGN